MAANGFLKIFFLKSPLQNNMLLYYLFLIQGGIHCLRFLLSLIYVLGSVTNHLKGNESHN